MGFTVLRCPSPQGLKARVSTREEPQVPPLRFAPVGMTILSCPQKLQRKILTPLQNCHPDWSGPGFPTSALLATTTCATLRKESRIQIPNATGLERKSGAKRSGGTCGSFPSTHTRSEARENFKQLRPAKVVP